MSVATLSRSRKSSFFVTERAVYRGFVHCDTNGPAPNGSFVPGMYEQFRRANLKKTQALHPLFARGFRKPLMLTIDADGLRMDLPKGEGGSAGEVVRAPLRKVVLAASLKRTLLVFVVRAPGGKYNCHALKLANPQKAQYLASLVTDAVNELQQTEAETRQRSNSFDTATGASAATGTAAAAPGGAHPARHSSPLVTGVAAGSKAATLAVAPSSSPRSYAEEISKFKDPPTSPSAAAAATRPFDPETNPPPAEEDEGSVSVDGEVFGFGFDGDDDDPLQRISSLRDKEDNPSNEYLECTDEVEEGVSDEEDHDDAKPAAATAAAAAAESLPLQPAKLEDQPWFHGAMDRKAAVALLTGAAPGTFLIRNGSTKTGYSLSLVLQDGTIQHFRVEKEGSRYYVAGNEFATFQSVQELVYAYNTKVLTDRGDRLLTAAPRKQ